MRSARTPDELRRASEHLSYEVTMLNLTAAALITPNGLPNAVTTNVFLEAFTIHARALLQFFFPTGLLKDTDVLAVDYVADGAAWHTALGAKPTTLEAVNSRVGTEIAHLSYNRLEVGPEAKGWNVAAIHRALLGLVVVFVEHVPSDKLAPMWHVRPILDTSATLGAEHGRVSTTGTTTQSLIFPPVAVSQRVTPVNTIAPPVPFKTTTD
jgi:hypothetical protein